MKALITAAGRGTRMRLPARTNKCLVRIGQKSLLRHSLDALREIGVRDIYIVTGYCASAVRKAAGQHARTVLNPSYARSGIIVSIARAKRALYGKEWMLITGDLLYDPRMASACAHARGDIVVTYERKRRYTAEDSKLRIEKGVVARMGKDLSAARTSGEFGHMMKFSARGSKRLFDEIDSFIQSGATNAYLMDVINALIGKGVRIVPLDITGIPRIEIDHPGDLGIARSTIVPRIERAARAL